jgi:hypothetical protein
MRYNADMRARAAIALNLLLPGSGLILLRREWLGAAVAVLFGLLTEVGIWGCLIAPAAVPTWVVTASLVAAGVLWLGAQVLLRRQLATFETPAVRRELEHLRRQAAQLLAAGDTDQALDTLAVALALNDEDLESLVQQAELLTRLGRTHDAQRVWRQIRQLDRTHRYLPRAADPAGELTGGVREAAPRG